MYLSIIFNLLLFATLQAKPLPQVFDRTNFYKIIASGNITEIDAQLNIVKESSLPEKEAFEGVLLMKKAGMAGKAKEKLSLFKAGRGKLEAAIATDNTNIEYRFLRLLIQEHAPKIVKYRAKLDEDAEQIRSNFKGLSPVLQQVIMDYNKKSTILKIQ